MNVLHISRQFLPCIGGTEKYVYEVARRLIKHKINCKVLSLNYNLFDKTQKFKNYEIIDDVEVYRIPGFGYYKKPIPLNLPLNLFKWADIVHIHDLRLLYETSILLKGFFRYKIVWSTHGFLLHTKDFKSLKTIIIPLYYKPTIKKFVDSIICVSQQDFEYFRRWNLKGLYLIENGIDFEKFAKIERNPQKGNFLYFGRIDTNKGLDLLFIALSFLKNLSWHLDIIGDGFKDVIQKLKTLSQNLNIAHKITWHGFVDEDKLLNFLSKAHLCFFPSTYEGFGFTLLEAMACGCICVANKIPTYEDLITDEKVGFLVNYSEPKAASDRIKNLLDTPVENFIEISRDAKEKAKKYDWEEKIREIISIYNKLLS